MRITLVISSLGAGGAERVLALLGNAWAQKGWAVTLLSFDSDAAPFQKLDPKIRHRPLGLTGPSAHGLAALFNARKRVRVLREALRESRPEAILSFGSQINVFTLLAARGGPVPVVVSERVDPATFPLGFIWERARGWTYPMARRIIVQTKRAAAFFPATLRPKVTVIANPAPESNGELGSRDNELVAVGRLDPQKGFDLLLEAWARLAPAHPDWKLTILGEGPMRPALEAQARALKLQRVSLPGVVSDVDYRLRQAGVFALPSRFEGFPNALLEAMAAGAPVVAADCPSGPREIIRPGIDGLLVPVGDVEALAKALGRLMGDPGERARLGAKAAEVSARFGLEPTLAQWEAVLR